MIFHIYLTTNKLIMSGTKVWIELRPVNNDIDSKDFNFENFDEDCEEISLFFVPYVNIIKDSFDYHLTPFSCAAKRSRFKPGIPFKDQNKHYKSFNIINEVKIVSTYYPQYVFLVHIYNIKRLSNQEYKIDILHCGDIIATNSKNINWSINNFHFKDPLFNPNFEISFKLTPNINPKCNLYLKIDDESCSFPTNLKSKYLDELFINKFPDYLNLSIDQPLNYFTYKDKYIGFNYYNNPIIFGKFIYYEYPMISRKYVIMTKNDILDLINDPIPISLQLIKMFNNSLQTPKITKQKSEEIQKKLYVTPTLSKL